MNCHQGQTKHLEGTRWLSRWDKEVELWTKLLYFGLTVGRGMAFSVDFVVRPLNARPTVGSQTLGEEYTDIWMHSASAGVPSWHARAALVLLPTFPSYMFARWGAYLSPTSRFASLVRRVPILLEIFSEINLAAFYFRGTYYDLTKRILGIRYVSA